MVDWGALCRAPCYVAAVYNLKPVAKCLALSFSFLRNSGMPVQRTTCVGHSLGAHICGLMANYLDFRIERIIGKCELITLHATECAALIFCVIIWICFSLFVCDVGLDPARPLIKPGIQNRLDSGDAKSVQVMHTNAGYYGEGGRVGHVDFCVNGGKRQPYCSNTTSERSSLTNAWSQRHHSFIHCSLSLSLSCYPPDPNLCSHIWAVCYLSQSIYDSSLMNAEPCTRRCPVGLRNLRNNRFQFRQTQSLGFGIPMGQHTPMK